MASPIVNLSTTAFNNKRGRVLRAGQMDAPSGACCHSCHYRQEQVVFCREGPRHAWCARCLSNRLNLTFQDALAQQAEGKWKCPVCELTCPCAACQRKRQAACESNTSKSASAEGTRAGVSQSQLLMDSMILNKKLHGVYLRVRYEKPVHGEQFNEATATVRPASNAVFQLPSRNDHPEFYKYHAHAICLQNLAQRLKDSSYRSAQEFWSDVEVMFQTFSAYYPKESTAHSEVLQVKSMFSQYLKEAFPEEDLFNFASASFPSPATMHAFKHMQVEASPASTASATPHSYVGNVHPLLLPLRQLNDDEIDSPLSRIMADTPKSQQLGLTGLSPLSSMSADNSVRLLSDAHTQGAMLDGPDPFEHDTPSSVSSMTPSSFASASPMSTVPSTPGKSPISTPSSTMNKGGDSTQYKNAPIIPRIRRRREITNCPHKDRKHYAKGMCNNCYHRSGRQKPAWLCPHTDRLHYARGKCQLCYLNFYHKWQRQQMKLKKSQQASAQTPASQPVPSSFIPVPGKMEGVSRPSVPSEPQSKRRRLDHTPMTDYSPADGFNGYASSSPVMPTRPLHNSTQSSRGSLPIQPAPRLPLLGTGKSILNSYGSPLPSSMPGSSSSSHHHSVSVVPLSMANLSNSVSTPPSNSSSSSSQGGNNPAAIFLPFSQDCKSVTTLLSTCNTCGSIVGSCNCFGLGTGFSPANNSKQIKLPSFNSPMNMGMDLQWPTNFSWDESTPMGDYSQMSGLRELQNLLNCDDSPVNRSIQSPRNSAFAPPANSNKRIHPSILSAMENGQGHDSKSIHNIKSVHNVKSVHNMKSMHNLKSAQNLGHDLKSVLNVQDGHESNLVEGVHF
eukprot:GILJ01001315.1.p1 GENE.GILJ01001315.1~~GILJ01001315.1.p1  ORF type:complete len:842 (+),score=144.64 GILJ01001315.1:194-2719(+)